MNMVIFSSIKDMIQRSLIKNRCVFKGRNNCSVLTNYVSKRDLVMSGELPLIT